jgi:hypothetical protein
VISSICPDTPKGTSECIIHRNIKNELWKVIDKIADSSQKNELRIEQILRRQNLALIISIANTLLLLSLIL